MKARTKNQKRVVKLNKKIRPIGKLMIKWAEQNVLRGAGIMYKSGALNCLKCGHREKKIPALIWQDQLAGYSCPSCKTSLKIERTNQRTRNDQGYFTYVQTIEEYQLIRGFKIYAEYKCLEKAKYYVSECTRLFINEKGDREIIARLYGGYSSWNAYWTGALDLRSRDHIDGKYAIQGKIYDKWSLQDYVIQKGFNAYSYAESDYTISAFLSFLLSSSIAETLLKQGNMKLFDSFLKNRDLAKKFWSSIKIALRHDYKLPDLSSYFDLLLALKYFNKDLHNPYYICPEDFHLNHDYWINRKAKVEREIRLSEQKKRALKRLAEDPEREKYNERMKTFQSLEFKAKDIVIVPLLDIYQVQEAGDILSHCIYMTDRYWKDSTNILFGTYVNGQLIETTQYCQKQNMCLHSYGRFNKPSSRHNLILKTIHEHKNEIFRVATKKVRKTKRKSVA